MCVCVCVSYISETCMTYLCDHCEAAEDVQDAPDILVDKKNTFLQLHRVREQVCQSVSLP